MNYLRSKLEDCFKLGFINEDKSIEVEGFTISSRPGMDLMNVLNMVSSRFLVDVYLTELLIKPSIKVLVASNRVDVDKASWIKPVYVVDSESNFDEIVNSLIERELKFLKKSLVTLEVNGKLIPLNPFVENIFRSIVKALISTLKGVEEGEVFLSIKE